MRQLEVRVGRERRGAAITQLQAHVDHVAVALEGEDLLDLESVPALRAQAQFHALGARCERSRSRRGAPQGAVVGTAFASDAALRLVLVGGADEH